MLSIFKEICMPIMTGNLTGLDQRRSVTIISFKPLCEDAPRLYKFFQILTAK